jgi:hypothetical protein
MTSDGGHAIDVFFLSIDEGSEVTPETYPFSETLFVLEGRLSCWIEHGEPVEGGVGQAWHTVADTFAVEYQRVERDKHHFTRCTIRPDPAPWRYESRARPASATSSSSSSTRRRASGGLEVRKVRCHVRPSASPYRDRAVDVGQSAPAVELRRECARGRLGWRLRARQHRLQHPQPPMLSIVPGAASLERTARRTYD